MAFVRWSRVWTFLALTFAATWVVAYTPKLLGIPFEGATRIATSVVCMWLPGTVALLLGRRWYPGTVASTLGLRFHVSRGLVGTFAFPIAASLLACVFTAYVPGIDFRTDGSTLAALFGDKLPADQLAKMQAQFAEVGPFGAAALAAVSAVVAGATVNAAAALGEELGWRGILFHELAPLGFWWSVAFTGVVWGLWHAPLILQGHNYPDAPVAGVFFMCAFTLALSPMHAWSRERNDSTIAAAMTHGAINAAAGLTTLFVMPGAPTFLVGLAGAPGLVAGALVSVVIAVLRSRR